MPNEKQIAMVHPATLPCLFHDPVEQGNEAASNKPQYGHNWNRHGALGPFPAQSVAIFADLGLTVDEIARYFGVDRSLVAKLRCLGTARYGARTGPEKTGMLTAINAGRKRQVLSVDHSGHGGKIMEISNAMHKHADWASADTPVCEIARIMKKDDIGAVPIGKDDRLVGMITDRDIALRVVAEGRDIHKVTAEEIMSKGIVYCRTAETLEDAIHLMEQKQIRRLPVLDENKRLAGMLSLEDISHAVNRYLGRIAASDIGSP